MQSSRIRLIVLFGILCTVAATATWLLAAPDDAGAPPIATTAPAPATGRPDSTPVITTLGVGPLKIGWPTEDLVRDGDLTVGDSTEPCPPPLTGRRQLAGAVVHPSDEGTALVILVLDGPLATEDDIQVGSTAADLRRAYGERLRRHTAPDYPDAETYLLSSGTRSLGFALQNGAVDKIMIGATGTLQAIFDTGEFGC